MVVSTERLKMVCAIELIRSLICWLMADCTMFCGTCCGTIFTTACEV